MKERSASSPPLALLRCTPDAPPRPAAHLPRPTSCPLAFFAPFAHVIRRNKRPAQKQNPADFLSLHVHGDGDGDAELGDAAMCASPLCCPSPPMCAACCSASLPFRVSTCTTSDLGREKDEVRDEAVMLRRRGCDMALQG